MYQRLKSFLGFFRDSKKESMEKKSMTEKKDPWNLKCADCGEIFNLRETRICPCWKKSHNQLPFSLGEEVEIMPLGRIVGRVVRLPPSTKFKFKVDVFGTPYFYYGNQLKKARPFVKEGY